MRILPQYLTAASQTVVRRSLAACGLAALIAFSAAPVQAQHGGRFQTVIDEGATIEDKTGQKAALELQFTDEKAQAVRLADRISGELPIILNPGYYSCPGMCGRTLNDFLALLSDGGLEPGRDFELITVSVDPTETARLADEKKATYVDYLTGDAEAAPAWLDGWHFYTGDEAAIVELTDSVGWRYRLNSFSNEYDHSPYVVVLTKDGVVSRYIAPTYVTSDTLRAAVVEAGDGAVGSFVEQILVSCLTFDPRTQAYTLTAMTVMQIGGVLTVLAVALMIFVLWRRERSRHRVVEAVT